MNWWFDPLSLALPLSALTTIIVSRMTKSPDATYLAKRFANVGGNAQIQHDRASPHVGMDR